MVNAKIIKDTQEIDSTEEPKKPEFIEIIGEKRKTDEKNVWVKFSLKTTSQGYDCFTEKIISLTFESSGNEIVDATANYLLVKWTEKGELSKIKRVDVDRKKYLVDRESVLENLDELNAITYEQYLKNIKANKKSMENWPYIRLAIKALDNCFDLWQWKKVKPKNILKRTGIFYNYGLTLLIYALSMIMLTIGWGNADPDAMEYIGSIRFYFDIFVINIFVIIVSILLVRDTSDNLQDILFKNSDEFRQIFDNDFYFDKYRSEMNRFVNTDYAKFAGLIFASLFIGIRILIILPDIMEILQYNDPGIFLILWLIGDTFWFFVFAFMVMVVLGRVFAIMITFAHLGIKSKHLSINTFANLDLEHLSGDYKIEDLGKITTFLKFHRHTRSMGEYLFKLTFKLIIFMVCIDLVFMNIVPALTILLMVGTFFCAFLFIIPQLSIHKILDETKTKMIRRYEELYDKLKLEIFHIYSSEKKELLEEKISQIKFIKTEIQYTKDTGTWAYDFPKLLRLVGAACLSLIPLMIEYFPMFL